MLKFSKANGKLKKLQQASGKRVFSFDILAGHTCPFAKDCHSRVEVDKKGKRSIKDGKHTQFRCYAASLEVSYPATYNLHRHNTDIVRQYANAPAQLSKLIADNLPDKAEIIRIHTAGDFYSKNYMKAWIRVANEHPSIRFYTYTKSTPFWVELQESIPENMILTASRGGKRDDLITSHNLKESVVVYSEKEAANLGLEIDNDDTHACFGVDDFALLLHGVQPAGSEAAKALSLLKKKGQNK